MKALLFIPLLVTSVLGSFLDGLNRSFDDAEKKIVDLYVSMPTEEVQKLVKAAQMSESQVQMSYGRNGSDFSFPNATMVIQWDGQQNEYETVQFKTGGMYARAYDKVGFNIKLNKKFLGRKNIRIRPDPSDKSKLRSKLCCDIANRLGLPSIQATYARLYMNNEYWGLYTLMDSVKPSWVKNTFNPSEPEITTLFQCKNGGFNFKPGTGKNCINANDDISDNSIFVNFVNDVNTCKTYEEIEKYMDVEVFLKYLIFEWLIGSFDHLLVNGHNFDFYKREDTGKWVVIYYDFDNTFGVGVKASQWSRKGPNQDGSSSKVTTTTTAPTVNPAPAPATNPVPAVNPAPAPAPAPATNPVPAAPVAPVAPATEPYAYAGPVIVRRDDVEPSETVTTAVTNEPVPNANTNGNTGFGGMGGFGGNGRNGRNGGNGGMGGFGGFGGNGNGNGGFGGMGGFNMTNFGGMGGFGGNGGMGGMGGFGGIGGGAAQGTYRGD